VALHFLYLPNLSLERASWEGLIYLKRRIAMRLSIVCAHHTGSRCFRKSINGLSALAQSKPALADIEMPLLAHFACGAAASVLILRYRRRHRRQRASVSADRNPQGQ
jgi:hypothetical protein